MFEETFPLVVVDAATPPAFMQNLVEKAIRRNDFFDADPDGSSLPLRRQDGNRFHLPVDGEMDDELVRGYLRSESES